MFDGEPSPDVTGRMLASTTVTTYGYVYDGGQLRQMTVTTAVTADEETTTQTDVLSFTYDASGVPQTVTCGENTYLYVTNIQGDVVAILDSTGNPLMEYSYDAWGKLLTTNSSMEGHVVEYNPLRYRGYVYDTETALYYLQSRYYNPAIGRFINADSYTSTGQGLLGNNMFAYCRNNPVTRKDASGTTDVCNMDTAENGNPFDDYGSPKSNGGGAGGPSVQKSTRFTFASEAKLNEHYAKHNKDFGHAFSSPQEYADAANYVIQNGQYVSQQNAYVKFYGMGGGANFAFVGMNSAHTFITTFHIKHVSQICFY